MKKLISTSKHILILIFVFISFGIKSQIYINEIMIDPSGANDGANMPNTAEWIEFYNASASSVNIGCWFFTDGDFAVTFPSGTTIAAGGYFTVASALGSGLSPNLNWATCGCTSGPASEVGIFTNSGEQVILYNSSGTIVDAIIWSDGQLPDAMTTSAVGTCSSKSVSFPSSGSTYEIIGSLTNGSKERSIDGGTTWQNASIPTFGATNAVILPIELVEFNAEFKDDRVEINWITATEINNDYFIVERSRDGISFELLATKKGSGNSTSNINYFEIDNNPLAGLSYYRLKQTDYDGSYTYSIIQAVYSNENERIDVYPNPNESGFLKIITRNLNYFEIKLVDAIGQVIYEGQSNNPFIELDLTAFEKGVYILNITTESTSFKRKVIYN